MHRALWITLGSVAVVLGVIGIVLPLLPTTPFLLLAAFSFARGSDRMHQWLVDHAHLGPPIQAWREHGAISKAAKRGATAVLAAMIVLSIAMHAPVWAIAAQSVVAVAVASFLWSRPLPP